VTRSPRLSASPRAGTRLRTRCRSGQAARSTAAS
jgi:hypothetical protein